MTTPGPLTPMLITQSGSPTPWNAPAMNGLSFGALAKMTSLAQPNPSCAAVRSAVSFSTRPRAAIASMLIPAAVVPTLTEAQTRCGRREDLGQGLDQAAVALGPAFLHQRGEAADEVDLDLGGDGVERARDRQVALGRVPGGDHRDRADGEPAVDDRDAVPPLDLLADRAEPAGVLEQPLANPRAEHRQVGRGAGLEVDAHRHGADVELVLADHAQGGQDVLSAVQRRLLRGSESGPTRTGLGSLVARKMFSCWT